MQQEIWIGFPCQDTLSNKISQKSWIICSGPHLQWQRSPIPVSCCSSWVLSCNTSVTVLYIESQQSCFHFSPLLDWELQDPTTVPRHLGMVSLQTHVTLLFRLFSKELPRKGRDSSPLKAQRCPIWKRQKSKHLQVLWVTAASACNPTPAAPLSSL